MNEAPDNPLTVIPREPFGQLFLRFLRFGLLAWGGPVAQIAMLKQELVEEEHWISREHFNRVLAVYQVLPGPEAHELCVYFGTLARGRLGGILAGLGFMLPGFLLMFLLSWVYVQYGITSSLFAAIFFGFKPAVAALIVRAVHRIGQHALTNRWLWLIAVGAGLATILDVNFLIALLGGGLVYLLVKRQLADLLTVPAILFSRTPLLLETTVLATPSLLELFISGLRTGLLTFGGAYTAIPFLQRDAVEVGRWMTDAQFLDGLALSGILPAPLIIFTTFVGYLGGGLWGALVLTVGAFLPAFTFTLLGHGFFERLVQNQTVRAFLDGVMAGVIGLIAMTTLEILWNTRPQALPHTGLFLLTFFTGLWLLYRWKSKLAVPVIILLAGCLGLVSLFWQ